MGDKEEKPETVESGDGQLPDKNACVEELGEAEEEIIEASQPQNAGSDEEKEEIQGEPVVSVDIQEKLQEKEIVEDTKLPEKAASVGEDEKEMTEEGSQSQNTAE